MTELFGVPLDTLTTVLLIVTIVIILGVVVLALANRIFFKIGVRNIPRRRTQMLLIVFALMLSTTLLSSVLATGDVITAGVQSVAVYNLGTVDEIVEGGQGDLGFYDEYVYFQLRDRLRHDPDIAGIAASLTEHNLLLADVTSRQVRANVTALALIPGSEQGFAGIQDATSKQQLTVAELGPNEVFLNQSTAQPLNAHAGDTLYIYSKRWPGKRYQMHVKAIVQNGGLVGGQLNLVSNISTFRAIEGRHDDITQIFISIHGSDSLGVDISERVEDAIRPYLPPPAHVHIFESKELGVKAAQTAQNIFTRIFTLFALFALAVGLLLIFLIFVLLAAERRAEMGMARAIGVQRRHLILMYVFEGTVYDLLASFVGLLIGVGLGAALVIFLQPILARFNFPIQLNFQAHSLILAYCLGVIFTFVSIALSAWLVSRMTVVDALRNLPEADRPELTLGEIFARLFVLVKRVGASQRLRHILFEQIPDTLLNLVRTLARLGILPLAAGFWLIQVGLQQALITPFSLGLSLIIIGAGLALKAAADWILIKLDRRGWKRYTQRIFAGAAGLTILAYWALPFDALQGLGLPRFQGGIEVFFVAGSMMVLGAVWALMANAELFVYPLLAICSWFSGLRMMTRLASAYPLHHRFRTGLSVIMFTLVIFAMTVMAIITSAMQNNYTSIDFQTGGYDIQAVAYFRAIPDMRAALVQHGIDPNAFTAIGQSTSTAVGVIQPNAPYPAWRLYPADVVSGGFLQGYGLHLTARAQGFNSDSAVWQALQTHANYALIDSSALPNRLSQDGNAPVYDPNAPSSSSAGGPSTPPGFNAYYTFGMSGAYQGDTTFPATPIWTLGFQSAQAVTSPDAHAMKLTIIGVVDNSDNAHYGLYISQAAYQHFTTNADTPEAQTYYFKVAPGQDKHALALKIGSAFLDNGLETTVLEDAILTQRWPRILLSDILLGVVGLTLLLGMAALAITGTRAVIERRQQIGMMRALGCKRRLLQGAFLSESFFVGALGSILGVILGLILSSNIFAVDFFEQFNTGLVFVIPWQELGAIVGVAMLASLLAAALPAWQAGRVAPTEALRI